MKYKVIAEILDGTVCANSSRITCFVSNSLQARVDDNPNGSVGFKIKIGDILPKNSTDWAEHYWSYSRKEWDKMNEAFQKLK